ncbi:MAG: glycosyltransferase family 2 protein [Treponema sp.]|nr:glycosyltransferase family 2 protein [Treponema sp.]MCL2271283.1 glycosyltransferase family 2 protein [Treponema sp.]
MNNKNLVSIIIPTYNRVDDVIKLIDSLFLSEYRNIEIIVVDNNSMDNTTNIINSMYLNRELPVKVITLDRNLMAAGGRNAGIKHAEGEYLLFIDSDNIVPSNMINLLLNGFIDNPDLGFIAPVTINVNKGNTIFTMGGFYNFLTSMPINIYGGIKMEELENKINIKEYYSTKLCQNAFLVTKEVIKKIGGFDEIYYIYYEEADFGFRINKLGYKMYISSKAIIYHHHTMNKKNESKKLRDWGIQSPDVAYHLSKNRTIFMKKFAPWYCKILFFLFFVHVFCIYYSLIAVINKRIDIAMAIIKGYFSGFFLKVNYNIKIGIT